MPEIKKKLIKLSVGENYAAFGDDYVITEDHTAFDILRFLAEEYSISELRFFVDKLETEKGK